MMRAFVFPGQGSQYVGMNRRLPVSARTLFDRAGQILDFDLWGLVDSGDDQVLVQTQNTQPALFVTEAAWTAVLSEKGVSCDVAAGHSLGEFSALYAAGVLTFEDAVRVVRRRGEIMAAAVQRCPGTMAALIGLSETELAQVLQEGRTAGIAEAANYNTPQQTVISGETAAVDRVIQAVKSMGKGRAIKLHVGAPFHSSIMNSGAVEFSQFLQGIPFSRARFPVINNVAATVTEDPEAIRANLVAQFRSPVQWVRTIQRCSAMGVQEYLEVGPRNVLTGMVRQMVPGICAHSVEEGLS